MESERPKNPVEEVALPTTEKPTAETLPIPEITPEQKAEAERNTAEQIENIMEQLQPREKLPTKTATSSPLSTNEGSMRLFVDTDAVKSFLLAQGLSEEQAVDLKIEFGKLRWSNKATRFLASFLPGRLREIFSRIATHKKDKLKIFTNNLEANYTSEDQEVITREIIHRLVHIIQSKRPKKRLNRVLHFSTHLIPMSLYTSHNEKEARKLANEADLENGPWASMIQFSSQRKQGNDKLKIKV